MNKRHWTRAGLMLILAIVLSATTAVSAGYQPPAPRVPALALPAATAWSSGWVPIAAGATPFTHNLGGDPATYAVDLWFKDTDPVGLGITQFSYGGDNTALGDVGIYWRALTDTTIEVYRLPSEAIIDQVLLRIWIPEAPDFDSGWQTVAAGAVKPVNHTVGGNADDYAIGIKFQSDNPAYGIHAFAIGSLRSGADLLGAAYQNVTTTSIDLVRFPADAQADRIRVTLTRPRSLSVYDSGWKDVTQGNLLTLQHNIGLNVNEYIVRMTHRSAANGINNGGVGIKTRLVGTIGAVWQELTTSGISVARGTADPYAEQVRVRIFLPRTTAYFPLVIR